MPTRWMMLMLAICPIFPPVLAADKLPTIRPEQAREFAGKRVAVVFIVKGAKMARHYKAAYLDSEQEFQDMKNLGIKITEAGLEDFALHGILEPADHFRGKKIQVLGKVVLREDRPYIEVDRARQVKLIQDEASELQVRPGAE